jgi:hypothetical protein
MTSIRQATVRRRHRFSGINEWKETVDMHGHRFAGDSVPVGTAKNFSQQCGAVR